jgi:hypothetical protein
MSGLRRFAAFNCIIEGRESPAAPGPKRGRLLLQDNTYRPSWSLVWPGATQTTIVRGSSGTLEDDPERLAPPLGCFPSVMQ